LLPDIPTLAQAGATGFDFPIWYGIWAPVRTPSEIVNKLACDIAQVIAASEFQDWLATHDADPLAMGQAEFAAFVTRESERAALLLSSD
jgi:tripartite-type tricarboxylate transporter receptor subunit TctC